MGKKVRPFIFLSKETWAFSSASFLFSCLMTLYSNVSLFFFFAKKRTFYFILKSALFHKTGRFSKKFKHGPFNWKFPIKRKTKSSLPARGGTFYSRFCQINRKRSWYTVSHATLKKTDGSLFVLSCSWYPCSREK